MSSPLELDNPKWWDQEEAMGRRLQLRSSGKTLVLTNGCFDLLHTGHLYYLQKARQLGDVLWVALNGDAGVRKLKGAHRPLQNETERAYALAALSFVDGIITFQTKRLDREIRALQPDIYVKAGDYSLDTIDQVERTALIETGVRIEFLPFLPGYSTTKLITKISSAANVD